MKRTVKVVLDGDPGAGKAMEPASGATADTGPAEGPLSAPPAQVADAADKMATLRTRMGGVDMTRGGTVKVSYDDQARQLAGRGAEMLRGEAAVIADTRISPDTLAEKDGQFSEQRRLRLTAEQGEQDIDDSQGLVGRTERRAQRALIAQVEMDIAALPEGSPERQALESDAAELREWARKQKQAAADKAAQTKAGNKQRGESVAQATKKKDLARAMQDLGQGRSVDPQTEADLIDTYEETENE